MMKIQVNEIQTGDVVKFKVHTNSDQTTCEVPAHTAKAESAEVIEITDLGRYVTLTLKGGRELFVGRAAKVSRV